MFICRIPPPPPLNKMGYQCNSTYVTDLQSLHSFLNHRTIFLSILIYNLTTNMFNVQHAIFIKTLFRNLIDNKVSVIYRHSIDGYCIQGNFHPVIFSPFLTCKWFHPVLNSPKQSFFYERLFETLEFAQSLTTMVKGAKKKRRWIFPCIQYFKKKQ